MLLSNTGFIPGKTHEVLGIVNGVSRGMGVNEAKIKNHAENANQDMIDAATQLGADAIVNIKYNVETTSGTSIFATGTAVKFI